MKKIPLLLISAALLTASAAGLQLYLSGGEHQEARCGGRKPLKRRGAELNAVFYSRSHMERTSCFRFFIRSESEGIFMDAWYFDENGTEHKTEHSPISQVQFDAVRRFLSDHHAAESMRSASPEKPKSGGAILGQDLTADFFEMSWKNGPRLSSDGAGSFGGELEALFRTTASEGTI